MSGIRGHLPGHARETDGPGNDPELAHAIIDVARELGRTVVAPRGAPYFCLDTDSTYDLRLFDSLSARGIFRKYEFALEIGSGLGGRARWLAARNGCRIVGVDPRPGSVEAAVLLNRRVHMDDQVLFEVGRLDQLPLRPRTFTHVWLLDWSGEAIGGIAREAHRVLRSGGHFALQTLPMPPARCAALTEALREAGFVELEVREVSVGDPTDACRIARERLQAVLRRPGGAPGPESPGHRSRLQIFARRLG